MHRPCRWSKLLVLHSCNRKNEEMNRTTELETFKNVCHVFQRTFSIVIRFPSNNYFVNHVIACAVNALLTVATLFLNTVALLTFCKSSQLRNKVSTFLIMVQSCIDLGVGVIGSSLYTFGILGEIRGTGNCELKFAGEEVIVLLIVFSLATLSTINMERYLGIVHPLVHRNKMTRKRVLIYVMFDSVLVTIMYFVSFFLNELLAPFGIVAIFLYVSFIAFIYLRIYFAISSSSRTVHSELSQSERKKQREFLKDIKQAKTCFVVVACSLVCLLPTAILTRTSNFQSFNGAVVVIWAKTFALLNPSLNSMVFFVRNRMLRNETKKTLTNIYSYLKISSRQNHKAKETWITNWFKTIYFHCSWLKSWTIGDIATFFVFQIVVKQLKIL